MNSISGTKDCYGCGVCALSCKKGAIRMILNPDGFYQPVVDEDICVECGTCLGVCSFHTDDVEQDDLFDVEYFEGWSRDESIRHECSSGGVGYEIARYMLKHDYLSIVCRYNSNERKAEHYLAQSEEDLKNSIGSKYIQSDTSPGFSKMLKGGKYFVVGTPCQIDSVRRWMKRNKMIGCTVLVDFFCHGVPSMLMWNKYLTELEAKVDTIDSIVWRDKETGWHDSWAIKVGNRYVSRFSQGDLFYRMFLKNRCLSKPCYDKCKFKGVRSSADIRIGDLWGSKYEQNEDGVSGIIGLTSKGVGLIHEMADILHLVSSTKAIVCESQMIECAHRPLSYRYVMNSLRADIPLQRIDRIAKLIELLEEVPASITYYISRVPGKLAELLKHVKNT